LLQRELQFPLNGVLVPALNYAFKTPVVIALPRPGQLLPDFALRRSFAHGKSAFHDALFTSYQAY
jgi:hypothetical protein